MTLDRNVLGRHFDSSVVTSDRKFTKTNMKRYGQKRGTDGRMKIMRIIPKFRIGRQTHLGFRIPAT
jgi:hypothetical protein